jgi:[acyl-carrier-protein] S-malonyltransferase
MGKDFCDNFATARQTFEEANDILGRDLASIIFNGPEGELTETHNSQTAIYVTSIAILRVLQELNPDFKAGIAAGLSLGEYTALTAAGMLPFEKCLPLVQLRGKLMSAACESTEGTMAVVLGLSAEEVEAVVAEVAMPQDLWAANFNCPGQVVISGTTRGIEAGKEAALAKGAKRVLPLSVHGAFHSGLMRSAEEELKPAVMEAPIEMTETLLAMNVTGTFAGSLDEVRENLVRQVTSPVRWEQCIRSIDKQGTTLFVEIGCGKTLAGFNKRIKPTAATISIETVADLDQLKEHVS